MSALDHPNIEAELRGEPPPVPYAMRLGKFERLLRQWSQLVSESNRESSDIRCPPEWATDYCQRTNQKPRWWRPGPIADARLFGRIPRQGAYGVWSEGDWIAATREGLPQIPFPNDVFPEVGCDVARFGDDWTEIHARLGPCSIYHDGAHGLAPVATTNKLIELAREISAWWNEEIGS